MTGGRNLIAVVDDEEPVRIALRRLLRSAGYDVETFASGHLFLGSLGTRRPDCVVLDLHIPVLDGFAIQRELAGTGVRLPVIVVTGLDQEGARACVLDRGASAFLRKPVDDRTLLAAIEDAVSAGRRGKPGPTDLTTH